MITTKKGIDEFYFDEVIPFVKSLQDELKQPTTTLDVYLDNQQERTDFVIKVRNDPCRYKLVTVSGDALEGDVTGYIAGRITITCIDAGHSADSTAWKKGFVFQSSATVVITWKIQ